MTATRDLAAGDRRIRTRSASERGCRRRWLARRVLKDGLSRPAPGVRHG